MKKAPAKAAKAPRAAATRSAEDILPEYDFRQARPNKYAARYAAGATVVTLDPDVAEAFPDAGAVNEALRALAGIIKKHRPAKPRSRRTA